MLNSVTTSRCCNDLLCSDNQGKGRRRFQASLLLTLLSSVWEFIFLIRECLWSRFSCDFSVCRNYYLYEFGRDEERIALVAAVNRGRVSAANSDLLFWHSYFQIHDSLNWLVWFVFCSYSWKGFYRWSSCTGIQMERRWIEASICCDFSYGPIIEKLLLLLTENVKETLFSPSRNAELRTNEPNGIIALRRL